MPTNGRSSYARVKVEVQERMDGSVAVYYKGQCLLVTKAPPEAPVIRVRNIARPELVSPVHTPRTDGQGVSAPGVAKPPESKANHPHKPAPDHPWRRSFGTYFNKR